MLRILLKILTAQKKSQKQTPLPTSLWSLLLGLLPPAASYRWDFSEGQCLYRGVKAKP